jgi:hypothetical protein
MNFELAVTAIHEAGHAVMLCHQGYGKRIEYAVIGPSGGEVRISPNFNQHPSMSRRSAIKYASVMLAGELAEFMLLPAIERPTANTLVSDMLASALIRESDILQVKRLAVMRFGDGWRDFVCHAATISERILEQPHVWSGVLALAEELQVRRRMNGAEVRRILSRQHRRDRRVSGTSRTGWTGFSGHGLRAV